VDRLALEGIKVIEYSITISGSYCGKLLADMGADVIKIESPNGDPARFFDPFPKTGPHPEQSAQFLYLNTNKRGITLDLDTPGDHKTFSSLIRRADILIDDHAFNHAENIGFDWDKIHKTNPGLVYISITPYGRTGTRVNIKGDELTLIHAGGLGNLLPARSENINYPEMGEIELMGPPWQFSSFKIPKHPAPLLGEHNSYVLKELLGLSDKDLEVLQKEEIILE
jgi:CoA:oxalate CoA-transferase